MSQWFPESNPFTELNRQSIIQVNGNGLLNVIEVWLKQHSTLEDSDIRIAALLSLGLYDEPSDCTTTVKSEKIAAALYEFETVEERDIRLLSMYISDTFGLGNTIAMVWR
jgi:hypothetical protein